MDENNRVVSAGCLFGTKKKQKVPHNLSKKKGFEIGSRSLPVYLRLGRWYKPRESSSWRERMSERCSVNDDWATTVCRLEVGTPPKSTGTRCAHAEHTFWTGLVSTGTEQWIQEKKRIYIYKKKQRMDGRERRVAGDCRLGERDCLLLFIPLQPSWRHLVPTH